MMRSVTSGGFALALCGLLSQSRAVAGSTTSDAGHGPRLVAVATAAPVVGVVKQMVAGDLMCYVTLEVHGTAKVLGASFEICARRRALLNETVHVTYATRSVSDCQSAEPCGKSRRQLVITKLDVIGDAPPRRPERAQVISNGAWTITIGNTASWSGVNGTGNLSYHGCDASGRCTSLTGGRVTCRNGECATVWTKDGYSYVVSSPITASASNGTAGTTLTVRKGGAIVLNATGFKPVSR